MKIIEVLEIKPVKNKYINIYLIRAGVLNQDLLDNINNILKYEKFRFAIIDFNDIQSKKQYETPLHLFLKKFKIPYYSVDIPQHVRDHLCVEILEKELLINELENEYEDLISDPEQEKSFKAQNLHSWISLLKQEVKDKKDYLRLTLKPQWIVKKVLDIVKMIKNDRFSIMHFTHGEIFTELKELFEEYNIKVTKFDINKKNLKTILI
ncbi:hypothetical protein ES705_12464 [subsurface metagenome]